MKNKTGMSRRKFVGVVAGSIGGCAMLPHPAFASPAPPSSSDRIEAIAIGHSKREDDMPSIATAPDGSVWAAWISFDGQRDDVGIRHFTEGGWQNLHWVPATSGDSWMPQVCVDSDNRVWVLWSQQSDQHWDIYARRFDPTKQRWNSVVRLSSGGLTNINPRVWSDGKGSAAVVWQGFQTQGKSATSKIFLRILQGDTWSEEVRVTDGEGNDWDPAVAIDSRGTAWISYDSYRNGNYDVFLAEVSQGHVRQSEIPVAVSPAFEARSTIAVDARDRVWVAWEMGHANWGKDAGHILGKQGKGVPLGGFRKPQLACYDHGRWFEPVTPLASAFSDFDTYQPHVFSDGAGSVWVLAMMRKTGAPKPAPHKLAYWEYWAKAPFGYWDYSLTHLDGDRWSEPVALPSSKGRSSTRIGGALGTDNRLLLSWPTDNRTEEYYHRPVHQQVFAAAVPAPSRRTEATLRPRSDQPTAPTANDAGAEMKFVDAMRGYRVRSGAEEYSLLRGDLHRHTELSWDEGGAQDGSLQDFYRYMIDVAAMDFGANTDHQGGVWPYWRWYSQKMTDMYHLPGSYTSLFSYERSASYPFGHRNIFFAERSQVKETPFFLQDGVSLYSFPLTSEGDEPADETPQVVENDTELLYEEVRHHHGISVPHTTGSGMGTDWHVHDPEVEPVVEIFQGMRQSYEDVDAPYAPTSAEIAADAAKPQPTGSDIEKMLLQMFRLRPDGMVARAWTKGYKLGVIASSDHHSTHISYAMVYTSDRSRQGILDAIRRRHTYGATDNIILEVHMGEHFMGDVFTSTVALPMRIRARGTAPISKLEILKDSRVMQTFEPNEFNVELQLDISPPDSKRHYYYVRLRQQDGMIAWSSPFFMNFA